MTESVAKLNLGLEKLDKILLELGSDFTGAYSGAEMFTSNMKQAVSVLKDTSAGADKATTVLKSLAKSAAGAGIGILNLVEVATKFTAVVTVMYAATKAFKEFNDVSRAFNLEKAILGTSELSDNFKILEAVGGNAFDKATTGLGALLNNADFSSMSAKAVSAYADVEEAAYRVGTVSVGSGQRAIDTINNNIKATRELQKATQNATSTVETLNAQYDIASAGFTSKADNLNVGEASIELSQAGFGDVAGSTNAVAKVLRALGDEADSANLRASQLFETTKVGLLTLNQLTSVIGPLSVQSKQLGIDFAEITGALAGLTTQGVTASEGATRLEALFAEITNASAETNAQLAAFRDEAGKPIQLSAAVLKDKGIQGVIKDLRTATGGNVAQLQKLFSTKEAVEAVQLLLSLGDEALSSYTDRIESVDPKALGEEAAGRKKTVKGGFAAAQNKSKQSVEDFGKGLSVDVINAIESADGAMSAFATSGAEAMGTLTGSISGFSSKIVAVGGFIGTAFSTVAPMAFGVVLLNSGSKILAKIGQISKAFKDSQQPGERVWDTIVRKAEEGLAIMVAKYQAAFKRIASQAKVAGAELNFALHGGPAIQGPALPPKIDVDLPDQKIKSFANALEVTKSKLAGIGSVASGGFNLAKGTIASSAKFLGALGIGAVAAGAALSIATGNLNSFVQLLDKRTNPALIEAKDNLSGLKDIDALSTLLADLDPLTGSIESASFAQNVFNESLDRSKKIWNDITGASRTYFQQTLPELKKLEQALADSNNLDANNLNEGKVGTQTVKGRAAETKIKLGIALNPEDTKALEDEVKNKQDALAKQTQTAEAALAAGKNKLKGSDLEEAQATLEALRAQNKERSEALQIGLERKLVEQQLNAFKAIDTNIPINIVLADNAESGVRAQIDEITTILGEASPADPGKFAEQFADIQNKLKSTTDSISLTVDVDVTSAQSLRNDLIKSIGATDFAKFIASNPQFRTQFAELNQKITEELTKQTDLNVSAQTSVLSAASSVGLDSGEVVTLKADINLEGISTKAKALNEELARPETTLARQKAIIAQIESLEAERLNLDIEKRIAEELSGRKQQLTVEEAILNVKNAELALLDKESRFGTLSVSTAKLKLIAAQDELKIKKEQLSLGDKEKAIKQGLAASAIKSADKRLTDNVNTSLGASSEGSAKIAKEAKAYRQKKLQELEAGKGVIEQKRTESLSAATANEGKLTKEQQAAILNAYKKNVVNLTERKATKESLFDENDRLRDPEKVKADLTKSLQRRLGGATGAEAATKGLDVFTDQKLSNAKAKSDIDASAKEALTKLEASTKTEIETRDRLAAKVKGSLTKATTVKEGTGSTTDSALSTAKTLEDFNKVLGTTAERFKILELQLNADFASREKVITQNKLVSESISSLAGNAALFGDSVAGANLQLAALSIAPAADSINKEADKEIAKIDTTVAAFNEQLTAAQDALKAAVANKAAPETIKSLENSVAGAKANVEAVTAESSGDKVFIEQNRKLQLFSAATDEATNKIETETKSRLASINNANKVEDALSSLTGAALLTGTAFSDNLAVSLAKNKVNRNEPDVKAKGEIALVEQRIATLTKLSKTNPKVASLLPGAKKEADAEIATIKATAELEKLGNALTLSAAKADAESAARQRNIDIIEKSNKALEGFASNSILSGSVAAASLSSFTSTRKANSQEGKLNADTEIKKIEDRLAALKDVSLKGGAAGKAAKESLPKEDALASANIAALRLEGAFTDLNASLDAASAALSLEYDGKLALVSKNEEVLGSLSSLASTASSLFSSSSIGSTLERVSSDIQRSNGKLNLEYNKQIAETAARSDALQKGIDTAVAGGADPEVIARLKRAKALDDAQSQTERSYLDQKLQLDLLNQSMASMSARVTEVTDVMSKNVDIYKEQIDLQQRQNESKGLNNKSGLDLQSSLINFLGKNNSATDVVNQRLEFNKAEEEAKLAKAANVADAQKQTLDVALLQSQLDLEQRSYENALTQTLILSDVVSVLQGGSAATDTSSLATQIPLLFEQAASQAKQRRDLVAKQAAFIPEELKVKNTAIDRDTTGRQLQALGQDLNPANIDLITKALNKSQSQLNGFQRSDIKVGSLDDSAFRSQLDNIRGIKNAFETQTRSVGNSAASKPQRAASNVTMQSPVNINVTVPTGGGINKGELERLITTNVNPAIKRGLDKVSGDLLKYAKTF